jgi:sodium-dependent dicarboxylate transporter 2/3/5
MFSTTKPKQPKPQRLEMLWGVPLFALLIYFILRSFDFAQPIATTAAVGCLMAGWWFSEAVPIAITSLLPIVFFPLCGVSSIQKTLSPYADKIIFLFLGSFIIASAIEQWRLHQRLALFSMRLMGLQPANLVAGCMISAAFLSLWISNTAVALMMMPVGISLIQTAKADLGAGEQENHHFAICMILGIAYASSIGGLGTIIGTPPNALLAAFMNEQYGITISFAGWLRFGFPLTMILLPIAWLLLTKVFFVLPKRQISDAKLFLKNQSTLLGPLKAAEKRVLMIFAITALFWVCNPLLRIIFPYLPFTNLDDTIIAISAAILLFVIPSDDPHHKRLIDWSVARDLPWHILLLFGGGLSLASAMESSGLATIIGNLFTHLPDSRFMTILLISTVIVFFGEIASNTATVATFLPILAGVAKATGTPPLLFLVPTTLAASLSFILPVGTPPNALAYSSGFVSMQQMGRIGLVMNLVAIVATTVVVYWVF